VIRWGPEMTLTIGLRTEEVSAVKEIQYTFHNQSDADGRIF
jgi:hypothetical protein